MSKWHGQKSSPMTGVWDMCPEEAALLGICNDPGSTHLRGLCPHTLQPQGSPPHSRDQRDPGERPPRPRGSAPPWGHPTHLATARSTWGSCSHFFRASTLLVFLWGLASRKTASDHRTPAIQTEMLALRLLLPLLSETHPYTGCSTGLREF